MTATAVSPAPARSRWELPILGALAVLSFVLVGVNIKTVPGGLPAHPLFVHVPVVFIPLAAIGGLVLAAVPRWYSNWAGPWIALAAVVALGALDLTMNAGDALRTALGLNTPGPGIADIINAHANAAGQLRAVFIGFTAFFLIALAVHATADGSSSGIPFGDRIFAWIRTLPGWSLALRALTAVVALVCLYFVYHVGDLGAKAVWYARLHGGG